MAPSSEQTELERLREENRHLRNLLAQQNGSGPSESTILLRAISDSTGDVIFAKDRQGRIIFANPATLALVGKPLHAVVGRTDAEFLQDNAAAAAVMANDQRIMATGTAEDIEEVVPLPDGSRRVWLSRKMPYRDATGEVVGLLGVSRDITEQKQAEAALRESEERVRLATEAAGLGVWVWQPDADGVIWENERMYEIYGLSPEDPPLTSVEFLAEIVHPDDAQAFARAIAAPVQTGEPLHFVGRFYRRDGALRWIEFWGRLQPATEGERLRVVGTAADVTERTEAEREVQARTKEIEVLNQRLQRAMRETHHRVKNNLQVIAAMAEMQTDGDAPVPAAAVQRVGQHTRNLANLHDLLTREAVLQPEVETVSAQAALAKLAPLLQEAAGIRRVECTCNDFAVPVTECGSLTMLISELVSNAVKHGAGDITVSLRTVGKQVTLQVSDKGPGFPIGFDPVSAGNTGMELILMLARHDLQGSIVFDNVPDGGARVTVAFTLAARHGGTGIRRQRRRHADL